MTKPDAGGSEQTSAPPAPFPWLTLSLAAMALAVAAVPGAADALALERSAVASGEVWRLLGGHWVHWSAAHLLWDTGTFAVLGAACELRNRGCFALCVAGSALTISSAFWWGAPQLSHYGGLSGVDCALFVLLSAELWHEWRGDGRARALVVALCLALLGKLAFEWATGATLFVSNLGVGVEPVPTAHAVGAVVGLVVPALTAGET